VALGGHALTITHTDGYPVLHTEVDSVLIGMGERYDVIATLGDGVFPLVASAEGKQAAGFALVRTGAGSAPVPTTTLPELTKRVGVAGKLAAAVDVRLPTRAVDRELTLALTGSMTKYDWAINGHRFDIKKPLQNAETVREGERVRLNFVNKTTMWHPMHLHGHTYQHSAGGPRKDTSIVLPGQTLSVEFDADNPGEWLTHCHNIYHGESGMMAVVAYQR
jgi:multicopper oxidase